MNPFSSKEKTKIPKSDIMGCAYCESNETSKVFETELSYALLPLDPATIAHILVTPKRHVPILEALTDAEIEDIFITATEMSKRLFDTLKIEGTNILINNGIAAGQHSPHFSVNIVGRNPGDNLLQELSKEKLDDSRLIIIENMLKEELSTDPDVAQQSQTEIHDINNTNYLTKQLTRLP